MDQHFLSHAETDPLAVPGTTVYRPRIARPEDAPALIRHYRRLGNFDRYTRFFSAMSDDGIRRYVETFDWTRMIAVCVYSDEHLVGVAELGWEERGAPERAELGISVDAGFRSCSFSRRNGRSGSLRVYLFSSESCRMLPTILTPFSSPDPEPIR